jgi:predicted dehydrogenase
MMTPVRIGIIGLGGYAAAHHQAVAELEGRGEARLICTCDPQPEFFTTQQQQWRFAERGVRVFADYRKMLEACHREFDLLVVPTPIPLHAEMHRAGIELGLAVYLEKPPTLDFPELEQMIERDRLARRSTLVGFNFIIEPARRELKRRLLAGEFGALRETRLEVQWARPASYFRRNGWAGRLVTPDGRLVLDSCFGNAIAHHVHNMLFWSGAPDLASWAQIETVQAELYRGHAIEGADTFFVEAKSSSDVTLRFALSHACSGPAHQTETVVCDQAVLRYVTGKLIEIRWADGKIERIGLTPFDPLVQNHLAYYRYLRGEDSRPATTLLDSRPFVMLNALAYLSSERIHDVPPPFISHARNEQEQMDYIEIAGLSAAQEGFLTRGIWPSTQGWQREVTRTLVRLGDLSRLQTVIGRMAGKPR